MTEHVENIGVQVTIIDRLVEWIDASYMVE